MENVVKITQIVLSILATGLVLMQGKGGGLSSAFGGSFTAYHSKRGVEKLVFISTIVVTVLLVLNSIAIILFF